MINLNKVTVMGNVTRDPELKILPSGNKVASLAVATNRVFKDAQGNKKEQVEYHNVVVFGKQAESMATYMKKGSQILIEGRLQTRSWDGADGKKLYRTEIVAENVQFGSKPVPSVESTNAVPLKQSANTIEYPDDDINADDIPF